MAFWSRSSLVNLFTLMGLHKLTKAMGANDYAASQRSHHVPSHPGREAPVPHLLPQSVYDNAGCARRVPTVQDQANRVTPSILVGVLVLLVTSGCIEVRFPTADPAAETQAPAHSTARPADGATATSSATSNTSPSGPAASPPPNETKVKEPPRNWTSEPWSLARDGWASVEEAVVFPGVQVMSYNGGCTVNFVFTDPNGTTVYVGTSAHCAAHPRDLKEDPGNPDYCSFLEPPKGPDQFLAFFGPALTWEGDGSVPDATGKYVYNSNLVMYGNETDATTCLENDFALIEVDAEWRHLVNPSLDHWGGPTGLRPAGEPGFAEKAYTVGGTIYRTGTPLQQPVPPVQEASRPREGYFDKPPNWVPSPWSTTVDFVGQCLGGDSGSPILDKDGKAFAVMEAAIPTGNHCRVSYLEPMLAYMETKTGLEVVLQLGTETFVPGVLPEVP